MGIPSSNLSFTDLSKDKYGSFSTPSNLRAFMESEIGEATISIIQHELNEQQGIQANEYEIKRILHTEQSSQNFGVREPELSDQQAIQMAEDVRPSSFSIDSIVDTFNQAVGDEGITLTSMLDMAQEFVSKKLVDNGVDVMAKDFISAGLAGDAADILTGRKSELDEAINRDSGMNMGMGGT